MLLVADITGFLDALGGRVFWLAVIALVVINGAALAAFVITRSRRLVDQWTPKLIAADVMLLGAGLGIPLIAALARLGIGAVSALFGGGAAPIE